jgi:hypothetical protein
MAAKFFVTGLPRSRTAWVANYLSHAGAFCYHDGLANCSSLNEFDAKLARHPVCGDSDSGLAMFQVELRSRHPEAQWVILRRPLPEVVESLCEMDPYYGFLPIGRKEAWEIVMRLNAPLVALAKLPGVLEIDSEALSTPQGAQLLWHHCLGSDTPWGEDRWRMLRDMNVTIRSSEIAISLEAATRLLVEAA